MKMNRIDWEEHWTKSVDVYLGNRDLARLRPVLKTYLHGKIADIGCGVTTMYVPGDDVTGVDISAECVRIMTERYPFGKWLVGDARNTGLPDAAFDTVVCSHVVEHFWDPTPVLEELKRVCKPDGDIVVAVPRNSRGPDHVHPRWYPQKLEERITRHLRDATYVHRARAHWIVCGKRTATASVVMPAWSPTTHRLKVMAGCLDSLRTSTHYPHVRVVVDNGPAEQTALIGSMDPEIHILNKVLHNPAESRNMGALATTTDYIAFVDNDVLFYDGWLDESIALLEKYPDKKLIVVPTECPVMRRPANQIGELDGFKLAKFAGSACWVMRRRSFLEIGRWNESDAAEDVDYSARAWEAGYSFLYWDGKPVVRHLAWHNRTRQAADRFVDGKWVGPAKKMTAEGSKRQMLIDYARRFGLKTFVETGTYKGDTVKSMIVSGLFTQIWSMEIDAGRFAKAHRRFRSFGNVHCLQGDSAILMPTVIGQIEGPALFWLDAHASCEQVAKEGIATPILEEIKAIIGHRQDHVIIIDDARYYEGSLPGYPTLAELKALMPADWQFEVKEDIIRCHR